MNADILNNVTKQFEQFVAPVRQFAELSLSHAEKVTAFQTEAVRDYITFGVGYAKEAATIDSPEKLQKWVSGRANAVQTMGKRVGDDVQTLVGLNRDYAEETGKLTRKQVETAAKAAKKAA